MVLYVLYKKNAKKGFLWDFIVYLLFPSGLVTKVDYHLSYQLFLTYKIYILGLLYKRVTKKKNEMMLECEAISLSIYTTLLNQANSAESEI